MNKSCTKHLADRACLIGALVVGLVGGAVVAASPAAAAATLRVCHSGCTFHELAPALVAAHDGDTIRIGPGTYSGGETIQSSVRLIGAGATATTIKGGGGSVLTIGEFGANTEPTVSITDLTITGGIARSSPESIPFVGQDGAFALGGGIEIPPNADFSGGATVAITRTVITDNRVAPSSTVPLGPPCPTGPCPFAQASGGGIDSWGTVTLTDSVVSNNRVGTASGLSTLASDSYSGAIQSWLGGLTITRSVISGNQASASAPNGRFADAGAVFAEGGTLNITDSTITNNSVTLNAGLPNTVDLLAVAGAIHIAGDASGTVRGSVVTHNAVTMTNSVGDATAFSGGLHSDVDVDLSGDTIDDNTVLAAALSDGHGSADSGAGELTGSVRNMRLNGNSVTATSVGGDATAAAGASLFGGTMTSTTMIGNTVRASSQHATATALGGALQMGDAITLHAVVVDANRVSAHGPTGWARGGGIFAAEVPDGPPVGPLVLVTSAVVRNSAQGTAGVSLQGGGIYATEPVTLTHTVLAANSPDQCVGC